MDSVFKPGAVLWEKYRVDSVLGRGGMGIVLKVTHLHLGEELAIKVLLPENAIRPDVTARFLREAQSVVRLRGEHVARVTDVGMLPEGLPFMVMEYLHGVDLSGELLWRTTLPPGEAVDYMLQACEALAEAHAQGIVHRDIKPANLFLTTRPDGTPLVKVLDFGISKAPIGADSMATKTEIVMGTPGYMSPEQMKASKDVDARTDIWALGSVLYECLVGHRPFNGESFLAIALMAGTEPPPPMAAKIPRGLQAAVLRCLEKDRRARFPSIAEFAAALAPFARNQREAATIVERTSLLLQRSSGTSSRTELAAASGQAPTTTLAGSAGAASSSPRHRRAIVGGISLLGAGALLAAVALMVSGRLHTTSKHVDIVPGSHSIQTAADDRTMTSRVPIDIDKNKDKDIPPAASPAPAITEPPLEANSIDQKQTRKAAANIAEINKILQSYLDTHDCSGLKHYISQNTSTSRTERVIEVFKHAIAVCTAGSTTGRVISKNSPRIGSGQRPARPPQPVTSTEQSEDDNSNDSAPPPTPPEPVTNATSESNDEKGGSAQASLTPRQQEPVANAKPSGNNNPIGGVESSTNPPQPAKLDCNKFDLNTTVEQAKNLFNDRYAAAALSLISAALECKQSVLLYRLAGLYACRAHDTQAAKQYFRKIPEHLQAPIEQACQVEGINIRGS